MNSSFLVSCALNSRTTWSKFLTLSVKSSVIYCMLSILRENLSVSVWIQSLNFFILLSMQSNSLSQFRSSNPNCVLRSSILTLFVPPYSSTLLSFSFVSISFWSILFTCEFKLFSCSLIANSFSLIYAFKISNIYTSNPSSKTVFSRFYISLSTLKLFSRISWNFSWFFTSDSLKGLMRPITSCLILVSNAKYEISRKNWEKIW